MQEEEHIQAPAEDSNERKIDETDPEASLKHMTKGRYVRNWVGFLFLGLINNLFYVLINSSSQRLCADFHKENWIGAILWCNIAFGLVARSKPFKTTTHVFIRSYVLFP